MAHTEGTKHARPLNSAWVHDDQNGNSLSAVSSVSPDRGPIRMVQASPGVNRHARHCPFVVCIAARVSTRLGRQPICTTHARTTRLRPGVTARFHPANDGCPKNQRPHLPRSGSVGAWIVQDLKQFLVQRGVRVEAASLVAGAAASWIGEPSSCFLNQEDPRCVVPFEVALSEEPVYLASDDFNQRQRARRGRNPTGS